MTGGGDPNPEPQFSMPFPLALVPVALSAIRALVRFRDRVDDILALNTAASALPFALPPAPPAAKDHWPAMKEFFATDAGKLLVELRGLQEVLATVVAKPFAPENFEELTILFEIYCQAAEVRVTTVGPPGQDPRLASEGPSTEMRMAWFVVESHRLSRNPVITRVLLAAADTLLEFGAENAGLFIRDPRTRGIVETLLKEFAVDRDWDDASSEQIFRTLLGSAVAALAQHGATLSDRPAVTALFGALADVREAMGDKFVEGVISRDGFAKLTGFFLVHAANTPGLLPGDERIRAIVASVLESAGKNFDAILDDPTALLGVLESGLATAASQAAGLIDAKLGGQPLLAVVLKSLAGQVESAATAHKLIAGIRDGDFFAALYDTTLRSVAARPDLLVSDAGLSGFTAKLVTGFATSLAEAGLEKVFTLGTVQELAVITLETLAEEPEMLAEHGDFVARVLDAVLPAVAAAAKNGFSSDDVFEVVQAAVRAAASNLNLVELDDRLRVVLEAAGLTLTDAALSQLLTASGRKEVFFATLETIAANPRVWAGMATDAAEPVVQQLVQQVLTALATDPTRLLAGQAMVQAVRLVLQSAVRRGQKLITGEVESAVLGRLLQAALAHAGQAVGQGLDGESLPEFLERVVDGFLQAPFDVAKKELLTAFLEKLMPGPEIVLALDLAGVRALHSTPASSRRRRRGQS